MDSHINLVLDSLRKTVKPKNGNILTMIANINTPAATIAENSRDHTTSAHRKNTIRSTFPRSYNNMDAGEKMTSSIRSESTMVMSCGKINIPTKNNMNMSVTTHIVSASVM